MMRAGGSGIAIEPSGICLVSLSDNCDHQTTLYSMFDELHGVYKVSTVGIRNPKADNASFTPDNHYVDCPARPGIAKGSLRLGGADKIVDIIRRSGCRTVYFESVHLWNVYIIWKLGPDFTCITTLHDVIPHDGSKSVFLCQKLLCALSDYVVIKSGDFMGEACRRYGLGRDKVAVVDVWRNYPEFSPPRHTGSFLFFGRLRRYKGLASMSKIAELCPDISFKVVGSPDAESMAEVAQLKQARNVEVVDREVSTSEMEAVFGEADWVVLPYESASQSGVVIDAYRFSRPVIAFSVGAIMDQVEDRASGFLVEPGDIEAFAEAVREAFCMPPGKLDEFAHAAYSYGYAKYSSQEMSTRFAKMFNVEKAVDHA